ncbi:2'-5' RNA ligase family protein [Isoptericola sp. b441]|uniref:2'-5' RNA ligase family protein n=1 Tax=Actinotalea lenta TaxID=3064654 RepID=A0ABT9D7Q6_9CELL|nr:MULTISPECIES: 2'-5' RNA ligase family protein [unclassified Isoptericola]MDO8106897.1 2'-5' RNA ligase family protein [Isoptericola sp. b441]MDO8121392.1 2'-5' RNA ligase family protein [Isoptericola sp. b490]
MNPRDVDHRVLGVALTVPEPWATDLSAARAAAGDPEAAAIPPHVTLLAPVDLDGARLDDVDAHLERVAASHRGFRLHLRGTATFRPVSPVVFVQVVEGIADCERLAADVRSGPLDLPARFPYHPHVTIAHAVDDESLDHAFAAMAGYEATFPVRAFDGYVQDDDGVWHLRRSYPLG